MPVLSVLIKLQDNKYKTFSIVYKTNRRRIWPTNVPFKPETSKFQSINSNQSHNANI